MQEPATPTDAQREEILKASVKIREARDADLPYILDSWRKAAYSHLTKFGRRNVIPLRLFNRSFRFLQKQLVARSRVFVAVNVEDDSQIFGFSIVETPSKNDENITKLIHWVQTKKPFWCNGIATMLLVTQNVSPKDKSIGYTFAWPDRPCTHAWNNWHYPKWIFAPFWLPFNDVKEQGN